MRRFARLGILLFATFLFAACTRKEKTPPLNTLRYPIETEPPTLDWSLMLDHVPFEVLANVHYGLTRYDSDFNIKPSLAERWEISKDGKTYTFYLRDAKWSDGVPVKAEDFVFSWLRLLDPKTASGYAYFLFDVVNAEAYNAGKIKDPGQVGIKALDDKRFQVKIRSPLAYFIHVSAFQSTFPMRKDLVTAHPTDFTEPKYLVTTGPFRISEWAHDSHLTLEKNPHFFGERPKLDKILFLIVKEDSTALNLYERGELDIAFRLPTLELERLKKLPDYKKLPNLRMYYLEFNQSKKPFDKLLVRQAFAHAIDRDSLNGVLKNAKIPMPSWIPTGLLGYNNAVGQKYNPELAKELLTKAGYPQGKNFPAATYLFDASEMGRLIAEKLQFQWKQAIGAEVQLQPQEFKVYLDTMKHDPPGLFRGAWGADYPDPHTFMTLFLSTSGQNFTRWKNKAYDTLVRASVETLDKSKRRAFYDKAQKLLLEEDTTIVPLFQETMEILVKPYVKDFFMSALEFPEMSRTEFAPIATNND